MHNPVVRVHTKSVGVDIELWAHEHEYQRMWPVYNRTVCKGSEDEPYVDPKAPVHFITGSAVSLIKMLCICMQVLVGNFIKMSV